tara:strand:- start:32 stop:502 length:471 start_codon:yes stop_codon:yes gene_type:complete
VITTIDTTSGSNYIHSITQEAAIEVASNLRTEDHREVVEGYGLDPSVAIPQEALKGFCIHFTVPDGRIAGLAGVGDNGAIWMLCTAAIHDYPVLFARQAKRFIDSRTEPVLWNYVDKRNKAHLRLLKFLGFKFIKEVEFGPNKLPFILFAKWTHYP